MRIRPAIEHPNPARGAGILKGAWARPTAQAAGVSSAKSASSRYADCVASYRFDCSHNICLFGARGNPVWQGAVYLK